jgi:apolipoprotein D and lipocalin family protein
MNRLIKQAAVLATAVSAASCTSNPAAPQLNADMKPLTAISTLDLNRYLGTWHEIAKYPNRFQAMCKTNTTADYSILPNGALNVLNSCFDDKGMRKEAIGTARLKTGPSQLEVTFLPSYLRWLPFVWANYWVVAIDPDYQWSLVSEPNRQFAWVLAREKQLSPAQQTKVLAAMEAAGLQWQAMEKTSQLP